ncbi:MAG: DUF3494 domain-containing protein [Actinobacteria bacterium]|nr:DUF3494 domain-containing protein [Actinomycetota bacterium]
MRLKTPGWPLPKPITLLSARGWSPRRPPLARASGGRRRIAAPLAATCLAALAWSAPQALAAQPPVGLGTADSFAVLAGSTVTNTGPSTLNGDLGVSPGTAITGFPPGIINGTTHAADAVAGQAKSDLTIAYNDAAGRTPPTAVPADLVGLTLTAGVYNNASAIGLSGALTLDAQGDPNAVFVFQAGSTLITAANSSVNLINGAQPCNVYWQIGSSATLGTASAFVGNILALTSITINHAVTVQGRALARNGQVTLDEDSITAAHCAPPLLTPPADTPPPPVLTPPPAGTPPPPVPTPPPASTPPPVVTPPTGTPPPVVTPPAGTTPPPVVLPPGVVLPPAGTPPPPVVTPPAGTPPPPVVLPPGVVLPPAVVMPPGVRVLPTITPSPFAAPPFVAPPFVAPAVAPAAVTGAQNGTVIASTVPRSVANTVAQFGTSRLVHGKFRAVIKGLRIRRVVFSLNGRVMAIRTKPAFSALVGRSGGTLTARVTFTDSTPTATLSMRFRSAAAKGATRSHHPKPRSTSGFTG